MKNKKTTNIILDGIDSTSNVLSLINPIFAGITIVTFAIKQIINYTSSDDIIKRMKKIEKQLQKKKITIEEFKFKILQLSEHDTYITRNNLINILLNCIPETIDIYISIWIDFIMNEKNSEHEELCEILKDLNKNDLLLLEMIKKFIKYGEKRYYITSKISRNIRIEQETEENKKY